LTRHAIETVMGGVVLLVAAFFLVFAYTRGNLAAVEGYAISARFSAIDGLKIGDDVRISGIRVGSVVGQTLEPEYYRAVVAMSIDPGVTLPEDSAAMIASDGLLGGKYVAIQPGAMEETLPPGGEITMTQPSVNLETLLGKLIYNYSGGSSSVGDGQAE
jgi:phospholipid/cholesterol/gamma-HCH transport system substrate-binding protein